MIYIATDNYNDGFPLSNAYDDVIYQKANAEYYLKFRFPVDRLGIWKHLTCETILKADDTRGLQLFKIKKINKINGYVRVYAKHITDDLNFIGVDKIAVSNATGRRVMEALSGSTTEQHSFIFNSDVATMHTLNLTNTTAGKVLSKDKHSILGQWGGELIRDNFLVDLKARAGVDTEILFMNKKNVKNLDNAISTENITTRLKLSVEVEGEGNNKQTINATVDSPNINAYPRIYTNYLKVNSKTITNQEQLIEYGKKYFRDMLVDFPSDNLTVNVIDRNQERVNLFDTVWFRNVEFDIDKRLKVVAYEFSPMSKRYKKISFGALKIGNLSQIKSLSQLEEKIDEKITESFTDAFKIQKNLSELLKLDRKGIEDKLVELEEKSKGAFEVKKALFEADGTIPDVVKTKILDAVEGDIGRLKTIITEAELIKAIQAKLNFAEIKNALIDKAFINQIISDERFTQQFEDGEITTQNIFTKLKDSIKSNISKDFVTKDGVKKLVNDLTIDADGIRQITQQESEKIFEKKKEILKGVNSYIHKKYSDYADGRNMSDNSTLKYIGIYTGDKQQAPTNPSEYSWTKLKSDGRLHKAYANSLTGLDFTLVEPDENAKLFAKNRPRVSIVNDNDISDIWQANMFLSFKPNTKYTLTARAKGNSNKLWAYFRNNKTNDQYNWGQLEFRGLETKSVTFTTTNDVDDVLFKFVLVPEDEDWTGVQIDWFTIYEGDKRYSDYPVNEPAQYHKYRYFGYVFKEGQPISSDFDWFDLQQTSITNDKYTHIVYSDYSDGTSFGREPKKYMGVARATSPTQPTDKTAYKWFKVKGEDGRDGADGNIELNLLNGTKEFAKSQFAPPDSWQRSLVWVDETERYEDFAVKSTIYQSNGLWQNVKVEKGKTYEFGFYAKGSQDTDRIVFSPGWPSSSAKQPLAQYNVDNVPFKLTTAWKFYSFRFTVTETGWSQCRVEKNQDNNGIKFSLCGLYLKELKNNQSAPLGWSPSIEDLQGHTLIANVRLDGTYINGVTKDVKAYIDVFYDGQKIDNGFDVKLKDKGGTRTDWSDFWNSNVDNGLLSINKSWKNGTQNGQPLELIALVTYKDLNTIANVRLENIPDTTEIKEVVKKYKTFESTLEVFNSTIGEVKRQVIANEGKQNLILGSRILSDSDYNIFGKRWEPTDKQGVYTKIRQDTGEYVPFLYYGNSYLVVISQNNTRNVWQGVGFNLSKKKLFKGEQYSIRIPILILGGYTRDSDIRIEIKNHNTGKIIWGERLSDDYTVNDLWYGKAFNFTVNETVDLSDYAFWVYNVKNGGFCISTPFMCKGVELPNYHSPAPEDFYLQTSRIESSIVQTKNEIRSAVTENNFGTVLTQNATSLRLAWNNISNYVQFENGGMSFYDGTVTKNKLRARITDGNYTFWRDGYQLGSIGTGIVNTQPDKRGLSFFLDKDGTYMAWSYRKDNNNDNIYSFKWMYTRQGFGNYEADTLNAGCNVNFGWNEIKNFKFHSDSLDVKDGITGSFNVKTDIGEETMVFKNGLLISGR